MKRLVTKRLILRELKLDDAIDFFHYCKKPTIGPNAGWKPHESIEESFKILKIMIKDQEVWGITLKEKDQIIGTIGFHTLSFENALSNKKEIGYVLDDVHWGKGLMVEAVLKVLAYAFNDLELDEVLCGHKTDNIQSKRVIEKTGFTYTHTEERKHYDGNMVPIVMYKLTKQDYKEGIKHDQSEDKI